MRENRQKIKYDSQSQENLKLQERIEEIEKVNKSQEEKLKSKILALETVTIHKLLIIIIFVLLLVLLLFLSFYFSHFFFLFFLFF